MKSLNAVIKDIFSYRPTIEIEKEIVKNGVIAGYKEKIEQQAKAKKLKALAEIELNRKEIELQKYEENYGHILFGS